MFIFKKFSFYVFLFLLLILFFLLEAKANWTRYTWENHNTSYKTLEACNDAKPLLEFSPCVDIYPDNIKCDFTECSLINGKMQKDPVKVQAKLDKENLEKQKKTDTRAFCVQKLNEDLCKVIFHE